jgi:two-component system response regulator QseB
MSRIALLEDHERIAGMVVKAMAAAGIEVDVYDRVAHARLGIAQFQYAALIIDRGLPDGDGLDFLRQLRRLSNLTPCLILTARVRATSSSTENGLGR